VRVVTQVIEHEEVVDTGPEPIPLEALTTVNAPRLSQTYPIKHTDNELVFWERDPNASLDEFGFGSSAGGAATPSAASGTVATGHRGSILSASSDGGTVRRRDASRCAVVSFFFSVLRQ
jgi:hypothetical protein